MTKIMMMMMANSDDEMIHIDKLERPEMNKETENIRT